MNRLTVISPAYYDSLSPYLYLSDSCERLELPLHTYGMGEPWPWLLEAKVVRLAKEIEKIDSEYFLMTDAGDSFILHHEETIMAKFHSVSGGKVVVSAEKKCWPNASLASRYPGFRSPWHYLNSGGFIGSKRDVLTLLSEMNRVKLPEWMQSYRSRDWMNDQFLMSLLYIEGFPLELDTCCNIFQCMGDATSTDFSWDASALINEFSGTLPSILHFNGHTPGIEEAYEKRFALDATRC